MAKLVVLTQSMAGRSVDLGERTTIGRVEDNSFQIAEPSVSSRHCEILLQGGEVLVKDLNSTNGTFINNEKITERVLKPGQTLRLGNIELKLEMAGAPGAPASSPSTPSSPASSAPSAPAATPPPKKEPARAATGGVSMQDLEGGGRTVTAVFDNKSAFTKKKKSKNMAFWIGAAVAILIIAILVIVLIVKGSGSSNS
ncbi:MAG TPA: FHA domain-containing protein [Pseudomonadales bacterium]|nr:FHA domain-containing protein [Pseudomonadales bacterium]